MQLGPNRNSIHPVMTILFIIATISACVKFEQVSPIPEISYIDFNVVDGYDTLLEQEVKIGQLEFNFVDGDADFGVYYEVHSDSSLPDSFKYGLFINFYDKIEGVYTQRLFTQLNRETNTFDTIPLHQFVAYNEKLNRVGQNKTVKGIIRSSIQIASPEDIKDTFRLEFYIRDRALNKSNIEYTDDYFIEQ